MKKFLYIIIGSVVLFYITESVLTGQTRHFEREFNAEILKTELKVERVNKRNMDIPYITIVDSNSKEYVLRINQKSLEKINDSGDCIVVVEKDIFDNELIELKNEYTERQEIINSGTNKILGYFLVVSVFIGWAILLIYAFKTLKHYFKPTHK